MVKWLAVPVIVGLLYVTPGCERSQEEKVAEETEVDERFFGGTEIEKKEVIRKNGEYEIREHETKLDEEGRVEEEETTRKRPDNGAGVDVEVGNGGIDVDVRTPDEN